MLRTLEKRIKENNSGVREEDLGRKALGKKNQIERRGTLRVVKGRAKKKIKEVKLGIASNKESTVMVEVDNRGEKEGDLDGGG